MSSGRPARVSHMPAELVAIRPVAPQPIPLYLQMVDILESRVLSGQCPPGSLLGTEKDLAAEFGVSRVTVTHALDTLETKGLIVRKRAVGTFVSAGVRPRGGFELHGSIDAIVLMGQFGETREVECDEIAASPHISHSLDVPPSARVTRVRRLRANNGALNTFIVDYLPVDIGRRFSLEQLRQRSLIQLLDEEKDLRLHAGHQLISARSASRDVARRINVPVGTPILLVERDLQNRGGRTVAFSQLHYLGHPQFVRVSRLG